MNATDPLGLVGTVVRDAYEVVELISRGGLSLVYRMLHLEQRVPAALKCYVGFADLPSASSQYQRTNFLRVGRVVGRLAMYEEGLARTYGLGSLPINGGDVPCAILEWLEGSTLEAMLDREREGRLIVRSPAEALALMEQPLRALTVAHEHGVVHRDLKPSNFFVCGERLQVGNPLKILDFSLAKLAGTYPPQGTVTFLTPNYAAPEQFWGDEAAIGPWTDVFALALIMIELMIGGHAALQGDDFESLQRRSEDPDDRPTPRRHGVEVSNAVEAVFKRALAVDPWERFPSIGRFAEAMTSAIQSDGRVTSSGISRICGVIEVPAAYPQAPGETIAARAIADDDGLRRTPEGTVIAPAPTAPVPFVAALPKLDAVTPGLRTVDPTPPVITGETVRVALQDVAGWPGGRSNV